MILKFTSKINKGKNAPETPYSISYGVPKAPVAWFLKYLLQSRFDLLDQITRFSKNFV